MRRASDVLAQVTTTTRAARWLSSEALLLEEKD
jgi:hypothetical protein